MSEDLNSNIVQDRYHVPVGSAVNGSSFASTQLLRTQAISQPTWQSAGYTSGPSLTVARSSIGTRADRGRRGVLVLACVPTRDLSGGQRHGRGSLGKQPTLSLLRLLLGRLDRWRLTGRGRLPTRLSQADTHRSM